ncbi:MAG TPA: DNA polymerase III subunit gamma/tau [Vicinamibacteria bacterium]|nr:DNA polymerase III subunit gamma/tau [Vicinamibacteria bacterium]
MAYTVLARKWRPRTFDEVVGQTTVTRTLKNALASGRIGHAFLLSGPRGVGKTTTARVLAKALNCAKGDSPRPDPCGECASCQEIAAGTSLDVQEIDGATHNGVEQVRELRESARYNPARDRFKIWIIDEVHMLSTGAFNALLKTLEEPPPRVKFVFATTEYHKIPDTIVSRCQQYDFRLIPARELQAHLREVAKGEQVQVSDETLGRIAGAAEGSVRDALSLFDQVLSFSGQEVRDEDVSALLGLIDRELLLAVSRAVASGDSLAVLEAVERLADHGVDYRNFVRELLLHFREILLLKLAPAGSALLAALTPEERERVRPLSDTFSEEDLLRVVEVLTGADTELRLAQDARVTVELALLKLVQLRRLMPFAELVDRVEKMAGGVAPAPAIARATPPPATAAAPSANAVPAPALEPTLTAPAENLLGALAAQAQARPSLAQPLKGAQLREEGDALVLEVQPDFFRLAETHLDEYLDLVRKVSGRARKVRIVAAETAGAAAADAPKEDERRRARDEAVGEPAVQEALDLFGGRVVDVRESKPS